MKKYRKLPVSSELPLSITLSYIMLAAFFVAVSFGINAQLLALISCPVLVFMLTRNIICTAPLLLQYAFTESGILYWSWPFAKQELDYGDVKQVLICSNIENIGGGMLPQGACFSRKRYDMTGEYISTPHTSVFLLGEQDISEYLRSSLNNYDVLGGLKGTIKYSFTMHFEPLRELFMHVHTDYYITQSVYLRYRDEFDCLIGRYVADKSRILIFGERAMNYPDYLWEEKKKRCMG